MQLDGVTAVVTGGASGLGAATVAALAAAGARVVGLDLVVPGPDGPLANSAINYIQVDVTDADSVRSALDIACTGDRPLRVIVNCAGIAPSMRILGRKGVHDLPMFAKVLQVNLVGTFNVLALGAERIAATDQDASGQRGVIINTASIAAFDGQVGQAAYAASKGGVVSLTLQAARDLAEYGIRVCTIAPGIIDSPMLAAMGEDVRSSLAASVPFPRRLGLAEEYARMALSIIDLDYLNGETIRMDGALRMPPR
jgi:NAD(P)-dependent dehydrogenase (short-subunit alcohol dehydrogenase family)